MTQNHLIIKNSAAVAAMTEELREQWREALWDGLADYETIHKINGGERRHFVEYSLILRHRGTDVLFEIHYDSAKSESGEDDLISVRPVVVVPQQIVAYNIEDAEANTLHQHLANERFKEFV